MAAMDDLRKVGIEDIGLITERRTKPGPTETNDLSSIDSQMAMRRWLKAAGITPTSTASPVARAFDGIDRASHRLVRVPVGEWGGMIFVRARPVGQRVLKQTEVREFVADGLLERTQVVAQPAHFSGRRLIQVAGDELARFAGGLRRHRNPELGMAEPDIQHRQRHR